MSQRVREAHGHCRINGKRTQEYGRWVNMLSRCYNKNVRSYADYGRRGITVCDEWRTSFVAFFRDVGPSPGPEYTIGRIDNNGNYEPGNVQWETKAAQARNRRSSKLTQGDVDAIRRARENHMTYNEIGRRFGIRAQTACDIVHRRSWATIEEDPMIIAVSEDELRAFEKAVAGIEPKPPGDGSKP